MNVMRNLLVAALLAGSATVADAAQWDFSYVATVGTISGRIDGTLQGDANTIFVSSLSGRQFNGTPGPALPFLVSATTALSGIPVPLTLSLDGSANDIIACSTDTTSLGCSDDGFAFAPVGFLVPVFASGPAYGNAFEAYNAANWSITPAAIPEPSSWAMLNAGFGLVGAVARRRRPAVARAA